MAKDSSKFAGIQGSIIGKKILETLQLDLSIQHKIKHIFITKPTFTMYTKMDEIYMKLLKISIPGKKRWEYLCTLLK